MNLKSNTLFGFFLCFAMVITACGQETPSPSGVKPSDLPNDAGFLATQAIQNSTIRAIRPNHARLNTVLAWSPDKTKIALSTYGYDYYSRTLGTTQVYDAKTLTPLFEWSEGSLELHWSADSRELMGGIFSIWDAITGQRLVYWDALSQFRFDAQVENNTFSYPITPFRVSVSPNGDYVGIIASIDAGLYPGNTRLQIFKTKTGEVLRGINLSNKGGFHPEGGGLYNNNDQGNYSFFQWNYDGKSYLINSHDYKKIDSIYTPYVDIDPWHYTLYETSTGNTLAQKDFTGSHTFFTYPKADYFLIPYEYENAFYRDWQTNQIPGKARVLTFVNGSDLSTNQIAALTTQKTPLSNGNPTNEDYLFPLAPHNDAEIALSGYSFKNQSTPSWNTAGTEFRSYMCDFNISSWGGNYEPVTLKFQQFNIPDPYNANLPGYHNNICHSVWNSDDSQRVEIKLVEKLVANFYENAPVLQIVNQNQSIANVKNDDEIAQLGFHTSNVYSLKLNPNSKEIISASRDGTVRFWSTLCEETCLTVPKFTRSDNVYTAIPNTTGTRLATAGTNGNIEILDLSTGQLERSLTGHTFTIRSLDWSPDGSMLASASWDGTARIWNPNTGETNFMLSSHTAPVNAVAFSPNGQVLATASSDHSIKFWNPSTGLELSQLTGHSDAVFALAWSPDGTKLASAGADKTVRIWDATTGALLQTMDKNYGAVRAIKWINDQMILSGGEDATLRGWRISDGKLMLEQVTDHKTIFSLEYNPSNQRVFVGSMDGYISTWGLK